MAYREYITVDELVDNFTKLMNTEVVLQGENFPRATIGTYCLGLLGLFVVSFIWSFIMSFFTKRNPKPVAQKNKPKKSHSRKKNNNKKKQTKTIRIPLSGSNMLSSLETPVVTKQAVVEKIDDALEEEDSQEVIQYNDDYSETETDISETETENSASISNSAQSLEDSSSISGADELRIVPLSTNSEKEKTVSSWNYQKQPLFANRCVNSKTENKFMNKTSQESLLDKENQSLNRSSNRLPYSPKPVLPLLVSHSNDNKPIKFNKLN